MARKKAEQPIIEKHVWEPPSRSLVDIAAELVRTFRHEQRKQYAEVHEENKDARVQVTWHLSPNSEHVISEALHILMAMIMDTNDVEGIVWDVTRNKNGAYFPTSGIMHFIEKPNEGRQFKWVYPDEENDNEGY